MKPYGFVPCNQRQRVYAWHQQQQQHQCYQSTNINGFNRLFNPNTRQYNQQPLHEHFYNNYQHFNHDSIAQHSTFSQFVFDDMDVTLRDLSDFIKEPERQTQAPNNNDIYSTRVPVATTIKQEPFIVRLPKPMIIKKDLDENDEPVTVEIDSTNVLDETQPSELTSSTLLTTSQNLPSSVTQAVKGEKSNDSYVNFIREEDDELANGNYSQARATELVTSGDNTHIDADHDYIVAHNKDYLNEDKREKDANKKTEEIC